MAQVNFYITRKGFTEKLHLKLFFSLFVYFHSKSKSVSKGAPDVNSFKQIHEYSISNQAVNSFDWSPDRIGLAVCSSFDKVIRILISSLPLNL